jgi:BNR repeat-like domain
MMFETVAAGYITSGPDLGKMIAVGSRCAVTRDGRIVCSYMVQSELGSNDFVPTLAWSDDCGISWQDRRTIWPELQDKYSIFGSISASPEGDLFFYGSQTAIGEPGEVFWCDDTQRMKQNELIWAKSEDNGLTWTDPTLIPMQRPGAAEAPGAMQVTRSGRWLCCYAPYKTLDVNVTVEQNRVILLISDDQGATWRDTEMLRFEDPSSGAAESWVIELADGRLLGAGWHFNMSSGKDHENAYAVSLDGGNTWQPTNATGIMGQSTALAALPDGRALFIYNQRNAPTPGVWLAAMRPTKLDFGVEANEVIWQANTTPESDSSTEHSNWIDYEFGEPSITVLPDNTILAALWCTQPDERGIAYVKLKMPN